MLGGRRRLNLAELYYLCGLHKVCTVGFIILFTEIERLSRGKPHMYALRTYVLLKLLFDDVLDGFCPRGLLTLPIVQQLI